MPVVAVEQMCGVATAVVGSRARIAIIYNPETDPDLPYIGIHMQDIPRAYLADPDSTESGNSDGLSDYLLTRVDDVELARIIPDVDKIIGALKLEYSPQRLEELKLESILIRCGPAARV